MYLVMGWLYLVELVEVVVLSEEIPPQALTAEAILLVKIAITSTIVSQRVLLDFMSHLLSSESRNRFST
jgi:hypothetical protein